MSESLGHLKQSLALAAGCLRLGNPPFAALLIADDAVLAVGRNVSLTESNPLRHAEIEALHQYYARVRRKAKPESVDTNLVMFCSTEPCVMCMGALYWAGVKKVVFAGSQEELFRIRGYGVYLTESEIKSKFPSIEFIGPLLASEAQAQWEEFYVYRGSQQPRDALLSPKGMPHS